MTWETLVYHYSSFPPVLQRHFKQCVFPETFTCSLSSDTWGNIRVSLINPINSSLQSFLFIYSADKHQFKSWASSSSSLQAMVPEYRLLRNSIITIVTDVGLNANLLLKAPSPRSSPVHLCTPSPAPLSFCLSSRGKEDLSCCCDPRCAAELGQRMRTMFLCCYLSNRETHISISVFTAARVFFSLKTTCYGY